MRDNMVEVIKSQEPTFLPRARHKGYICPVCGNGKGRDGDGLMRSPKGNGYHCFKCGYHEDIFGLIGEYYGIQSFKEQLAKAANIYGLEDGELKLPSSPAVAFPAPAEEPRVNCMSEFTAWNTALNSPGCPGLDYMQERGLSLETLNRFKIGYAPKWKHPKTKDNPKVPTSPRVIIPTSPFSYLARDIRTPDKLPENQKRYSKSKFGKVRIFNLGAFKRNEDVVFVVEGEIDAMSIEEVGGSAVGLGSASNRVLLADYLKKNRPTAVLVLLPDNDEAGISSAKALQEDLSEAGIASKIANIFCQYKDANEMLVADRKLLEAKIAALKNLAVDTARKEMALKWDKTNRTLLTLLNLHERHKKILRELGLNDDQIERYCYRSAPSNPKSVCRNLKRLGCSMEDNPLFRLDENGEWTISLDESAIMIPKRGLKGELWGFECLLDRNNHIRTPKPLTHFRRGIRGINEVVILDSALKADIVCSLSGYSVLAVQNPTRQQELSSVLDELSKRGTQICSIAYDMAPEEKDRKKQMYEVLKVKGFTCRVRTWDRHKRLSDVLLEQRKTGGLK